MALGTTNHQFIAFEQKKVCIKKSFIERAFVIHCLRYNCAKFEKETISDGLYLLQVQSGAKEPLKTKENRLTSGLKATRLPHECTFKVVVKFRDRKMNCSSVG